MPRNSIFLQKTAFLVVFAVKIPIFSCKKGFFLPVLRRFSRESGERHRIFNVLELQQNVQRMPRNSFFFTKKLHFSSVIQPISRQFSRKKLRFRVVSGPIYWQNIQICLKNLFVFQLNLVAFFALDFFGLATAAFLAGDVLAAGFLTSFFGDKRCPYLVLPKKN